MFEMRLSLKLDIKVKFSDGMESWMFWEFADEPMTVSVASELAAPEIPGDAGFKLVESSGNTALAGKLPPWPSKVGPPGKAICAGDEPKEAGRGAAIGPAAIPVLKLDPLLTGPTHPLQNAGGAGAGAG